MDLVTDSIDVATHGDSHMLDVTTRVQEVVRRHGFREGQALLFVPGSTASLTTIEFEPGLEKDLPAAFERIAPRGIRYEHEEAWHDHNGHSHVRASLLGPSLTVPFKDGRLLVGTWQQIVLIDFDTRPRRRDVVVQLSGVRERTAAPAGGR
ncbi:MAG TPA: secondary thiamine-phosphate synthase enzyme YjbQ, partial [Coriobacteriia bacterium]